MGTLFGTDGVRGVANKDLTPELAYKLGRVAACYLKNTEGNSAVVIGRDTRISGQMLEAALVAGITASGVDVLEIGVIPTPGVAYLVRQLEACGGVVISASHNPVEDNGIKFFNNKGYKLSDELEEAIEKKVLGDISDLPAPTGGAIGRVYRVPDGITNYIDYLVKTVDVSLQGIKIVVDCANGAGFYAAPEVYRRLGADVVAIFQDPDGLNINKDCGSTHIEALQKAVVENGADLGIAHDGDADRVLFVDENGKLVDGDHILVICSLALKAKGLLKNNQLVLTVMSNLGVHQALKEVGIKIIETKVGDRFVLEAMRDQDAILGGEQSGHIIFLEYNTTGDGILTALQLLKVFKESDKSLSTLAAQMQTCPQVLVNVRVKDKEAWKTNEKVKAAIKSGEVALGESGRILVRASGTEALIRVMVEGTELKQLEDIANNIVKVIETEL